MAVVGALMLVGAGPLGKSGGTSTTGPASRPERHPEIRKALRDLRAAKMSLTEAKHDYEGHRVLALEATEKAIHECEAALKSDEK
jgi:hypothetical protein